MTPNTVQAMHRRTTLAATALLMLILAACGSDGPSSTADGSTTTTSEASPTTTAVAPSSTAPRVEADIVLRGDGLGVVALGATPEEAVMAVTAALGAPTADTGWQSSFSSYGTCPGEHIRGVEWDHLVLLFTDGDTAFGSGEHLFTWRITGAPPALGTAKGLGYKATVADAEELYPGDVEVTEPDDPFPGFAQIRVDGGTITAYLDGQVITNLEAGAGCGE